MRVRLFEFLNLIWESMQTYVQVFNIYVYRTPIRVNVLIQLSAWKAKSTNEKMYNKCNEHTQPMANKKRPKRINCIPYK